MGDSKVGLVERTERWIIRRAPQILLCALIASIASLGQIVDLRTGIPRLAFDPTLDAMLPSENDALPTAPRAGNRFEQGPTLVLSLTADDIFQADNLERLRALSDEIAGLESVQRVESLPRAALIRAQHNGVSSEAFYSAVTASDVALADLRERALRDPILAGRLIANDGRTAAVVVTLGEGAERDAFDQALDLQIREIARRHWPDGPVRMRGDTHFRAERHRALLRDLPRMLAVAAAAVALALLALFGTLRSVLVPFGVVAVSTIVSLAIVGKLFGTLHSLTATFPAVTTVLGFAYAMHLVSTHDSVLRTNRAEKAAHDAATLSALRRVGIPVLFAGLTTAIAFAALALHPQRAISDFGLATAVGVAVSTAVCLFVAPAMIAVSRERSWRSFGGSRRSHDESLVRLARFDIRNRTMILRVGALVGFLALVGAFQVRVGDSRRVEMSAMDAERQGTNSFDIVFSTSVTAGFKLPQNLALLGSLQSWLDEQPEISGSTSLADYVKAIHQAFESDDPSFHRIPNDKSRVAALLEAGTSDEMQQYVDATFQHARLVVRTRAFDSTTLLSLAGRIEAELERLPRHIEAHVAGASVANSRGFDLLSAEFATSLGIAFVAIYAMLVLLFTSFKTAFLALIPNVAPVLVYFGVLGWSGVELDLTTGLVAAIALGVGVDHSIHLFARFNRAAKRHADEALGVIEALQKVGKSVTYTTAALVCGFASISLTHWPLQIDFSFLVAVTLLAAWLVDVVFTPALAARMQIVTIWDVLTLDLGQAPQRSLPLFAGLSATQARITALLARIDKFPQGHRLLKDGASGDEMYLVIDGRLKASVDRDGRAVLLRTHGRGDVVGEVALFYGTRTADVTTLTDVRLLRFTQSDFENIQRRHPRIGAQLYANLNRVLASRMAEVTARTVSSDTAPDRYLTARGADFRLPS